MQFKVKIGNSQTRLPKFSLYSDQNLNQTRLAQTKFGQLSFQWSIIATSDFMYVWFYSEIDKITVNYHNFVKTTLCNF